MKQFIIGISLFIFGCIILFYLLICLADGSTDAMYAKFTRPKQSSLIIGSSRAAQGIRPKVIEEVLKNDELYNYAFTIASSPYGKSYFRSIKKKVNSIGKDGLFIICVNPWTISSLTKKPEDSLSFRELNSFIDKTNFVNLNPNFEYLIESFQGKYKDIIRNKNRKGEYQTFYVQDDGWLQVTIESDMISVEERTKNKIVSYKKSLKNYSGLSLNRVFYLKKTIEFLKQYGEVYVVRIPVINEMLSIENLLIPKFDSKMIDLTKKLNVAYINMMPFRENYLFTDGNHLDIESSKKFSKYLAREIKNLKK